MKNDENAFSKQQQEFTAMAVRNLPYLSGKLMQHFIENPLRMKEVFYTLPLKYWFRMWKDYYKTNWSIEIDLKDIVMLDSSEDYIDLIVVSKEITEDLIFEKMVKDGVAQWSTLKGVPQKPSQTFRCERRTVKSYGIWLKDETQYVNFNDEKNPNLNVKLISERLSIWTANLLEILLLNDFRRYFSIELDTDTLTCPGTLSVDGRHYAENTPANYLYRSNEKLFYYKKTVVTGKLSLL